MVITVRIESDDGQPFTLVYESDTLGKVTDAICYLLTKDRAPNWRSITMRREDSDDLNDM